MIKVENGYVDINGTKADVLSDLACLVETLKDCFTEHDIKFAVDLGLKPEDEIEKLLND
jgi:hypothetical protein